MSIYQQIIDAGETATRRPWRDFYGTLELPSDWTPPAFNTAYTVLAANHADKMARRLLRYEELLKLLRGMAADNDWPALVSEIDQAMKEDTNSETGG